MPAFQPGTLDELKLSSSVTVKKYHEMVKAEDRSGLSKFIDERLRERYITPVMTGQRNGFAIMACACLLVETMEAFYRGWDDTEKKFNRQDIGDPCKPANLGRNRVSASEVAFCYFFQREKEFADFRQLAESFYQHVRCGILHQGETTGGWLITRAPGKPVLSNQTIHAEKFSRALSRSLRAYCTRLRSAVWSSEEWVKFRNKMDAVIRNCA